jgi:hypothetical protein
VRTGSLIGGALVNRMLALVADHQFPVIEQMLKDDSGGDASSLTPEQKTLFRGVLANRENRPEESIRLLEPLVDTVAASGNLPEEKLVRKALAEDYMRAGHMARAAQAYQALSQRLGSSLSHEEQDEIEMPLKLLPLAVAYPPMTVEATDSFSLPYNRNALGLTDVPVFVDARPHDWMLDPTAPFNLIARSTAKDVGLKLSEDSVTIHSLTGRPMVVHATLIPRFTVGHLTYRNMTAFVFEDADYTFPKSRYQVQGVLGYPAVSAMGRLTIEQNSRIDVEPLTGGDAAAPKLTGAPFYLDGDQLVVALGKPGDERMFALDAAGQQTYMTSRYFAEHTDEFAEKKMQLLPPPGGKGKPAPAYIVDTLKLNVGDAVIEPHFVQVMTEPVNDTAIDDNYGVLGMDALDELISYTFDYRTMRFSVKPQ